MKENRTGSGLQDERGLLGKMNRRQFHFSLWYFVLALGALLILNLLAQGQPRQVMVSYSEFRNMVEAGELSRVELGHTFYRGFPRDDESAGTQQQGVAPVVYRTARVEDPELLSLLEEREIDYYAVPQSESPLATLLLSWLLPLLLLLGFWRLLFRKMGRPEALSFGKNHSQIISEGDTGVRFSDVAGSEEAKRELEEVVDFLARPERYGAVGGKVPKGVLMVGAPGTGKTLLARAVAGEAGVPFFRMSGADFVEMFVGVGAARVRDLFRQAREKAPCIIFIDELDAIGKSRAHSVNSNDEREQTLNQLLVEMDGFDARSGVIVLAATNRPEALDPALMRPGRFDRQVVIDKPDLREREAILEKHAEGVSMDESVDLSTVARSTPGLVGADLANIVNEAALLAVRGGRSKVSQSDLEEAIEKAVAGLEKRNKLTNPEERRRVAVHEAGHALLSLLRPGVDPLHKVSIVPRGIGALGYTLQLPTEDRFLLREEELIARIDVLLAGRAAEEILLGDVSTGASDDINKATEIVRRMLTDYGMSEEFRNVALPSRKQSPFLGDTGIAAREYSEATQNYIDREIARRMAERYEATRETLQEHRKSLERVSEELLEREVLHREELERLLGTGVLPTDGAA
ncbi:MAG: ATP-dependent zinc metalloprotease FtsH [Spirochaetaceae bacterium]